MQSLPLLIRQSFRVGPCIAGIAKAPRTSYTATRSISLKAYPRQSSFPKFAPPICLQCRNNLQRRSYSSQDDKEGHIRENKEGRSAEDQATSINGDGKPVEHRSPADTTESPLLDQRRKEPVGNASPANKGSIGSNAGSKLPSHSESRRSDLSKQFSQLMDHLQSNIFIANRHLNDLTGYSAIEKLKQEIIELEDRVRQTRSRVRGAKDAYSTAINSRSASQREVNELLQRKHAWNPTDLERFTSLYRSDHANERAETEAHEALVLAEREAEEAAAHLSKSILARYHEEQIWSDKIRRMSTWGTWGLMGVNVLLFLIFQIAVEPWRRKRLVKGFEEKVMLALEKEDGNGKTRLPTEDAAVVEINTPVISQQNKEPVAEEHAEATLSTTNTDAAESDTTTEEAQSESSTFTPFVEPEPQLEASPEPQLESELVSEPPLTSILPPDASIYPDTWQQTLRDLLSERRVTLSQRDLTTVALESAAAGAAVMGVLIAIFRPR